MVLDCGALDWRIEKIVADMDRGMFTYDDLMYELCIVPADKVSGTLDPEWNSFDEYLPGKTALLHYTIMHTQPWISTRHKHLDIWMAAMFRALSAGYISLDMVRDQVEKRFVRPSLLFQAESGILDPTELPADILMKDKGFVAPYRRLAKNKLLDRLWRRSRRLLSRLRGPRRRRS
jgi:hypothetical protein